MSKENDFVINDFEPIPFLEEVAWNGRFTLLESKLTGLNGGEDEEFIEQLNEGTIPVMDSEMASCPVDVLKEFFPNYDFDENGEYFISIDGKTYDYEGFRTIFYTKFYDSFNDKVKV